MEKISRTGKVTNEEVLSK